MSEETAKSSCFKWKHPSEVMKLQKLKRKKIALQARINSSSGSTSGSTNASVNVLSVKRKNPFAKINENSKKAKTAIGVTDESNDNTLFKLLNICQDKQPESKTEQVTSFKNVLKQIEEPVNVKAEGEKWIPIDWSLKKKVRFFSPKSFGWSQTLKISEEASGVTSFTRCLDTSKTCTTLDTSANAKFHQCCLYWQHPSIPWLNLFPRSNTKVSQSTIPLTAKIKESLHTVWMISFRSLFHLIRTRQCPYFYACANTFTVLFRAAGIGGFPDLHAFVSPTTRGFRQMLKQGEIEFSMPLKKSSDRENVEESSQDKDKDDEQPDEQWLQSMGINSEEIKQINYTQEKITLKAESEVDNSDLSLILIEGVEVQAFYSFLVHCKSAVSPTGLFAGIPPTLLAPVAFHGATLSSLQVRENKVRADNEDFYSIDLTGPILPHCIHNLCALQSQENSMTATFSTLEGTESFSQVNVTHSGSAITNATSVFSQENLSDCGLESKVLKHFCNNDPHVINLVECLKYAAETTNYAWT